MKRIQDISSLQLTPARQGLTTAPAATVQFLPIVQGPMRMAPPTDDEGQQGAEAQHLFTHLQASTGGGITRIAAAELVSKYLGREEGLNSRRRQPRGASLVSKITTQTAFTTHRHRVSSLQSSFTLSNIDGVGRGVDLNGRRTENSLSKCHLSAIYDHGQLSGVTSCQCESSPSTVRP